MDRNRIHCLLIKWVWEKELSGCMCDCFLDKVKVQVGKQVEVVFKYAEK